MTEFKCGSCKEVFVLSPKARFCPECGSSSLNLIIKELTEPAQKETLGVYSPQNTGIEVAKITTAGLVRDEEDQPRRRRR